MTLAANAVVAWTTEYYGLAVESMRAAGRRIDDEVLAHFSPAHSENINFFGAIASTSKARTTSRGIAPLLVEVVSLYQAGRAITGRG